MTADKFLPISKEDMLARGIEKLDFILVTGDAYVDHPSFGTAIIGRYLEYLGFLVGVIAQPNIKNPDVFRSLGEPEYGFLVSSGSIDSMVSNYTAAKRKRSDDPYSPGNKAGRRPDRAGSIYCQMIRKTYPNTTIIQGGLEASLRRFAHYDYWEDQVRPSEIVFSGADLLIYGMGELPIKEIARLLQKGANIKNIRNVRGTCYVSDTEPLDKNFLKVPSFEKVKNDKKKYNEAIKIEYLEQDFMRGRTIVQGHKEKFVVQNPPQRPLTTKEMDEVYDLPYTRTYHPIYESMGGIKAIEEVEFSILSSRGCFGGCNFCSITFHQGRVISARSHESILREAEGYVKNPRFKGYIHDVGGPTANFRTPSCEKQKEKGMCIAKSCLAPTPCKELIVDHKDYVELLRKLRQIPGVKKVFIRSGIRYDYVMADKDDTFFKELVKYHISGQLKVAPEHISSKVLALMGKPKFDVYKRFYTKYYELNRRFEKNQFLVPYLISSHPGSTLHDAIELSLYLKDIHYHPEQVQDFYPTPGTLSTAMFYTGLHPLTGEQIYIPRSKEEKAKQRALLQWFVPKNRKMVKEALYEAGREDLIGYGKRCLIPPDYKKDRSYRGSTLEHRNKDMAAKGKGELLKRKKTTGEAARQNNRKVKGK